MKGFERGAVAGRRSASCVVPLFLALWVARVGVADEPPALNPFGKRPSIREDAIPGVIELSDGTLHPGFIFLTRDARLRVWDEKTKRVRDIPLRVLKSIEAKVEREWMEREWRFREAANDKKVYTGRSYPAREYSHMLRLKDDRTITGRLSAPVYVQATPEAKPQRYILYKRNKGEVGTQLKQLIYVRKIVFGEEAMEKARQQAAHQNQHS